MKLLHDFFKITILLLVLTVTVQSVHSQELPMLGAKPGGIEMVPNEKVPVKGGADKPLSLEFRILDSLQNAYSYFTNSQQPFVYYPPKNMLVTIKRGAQSRVESENTLDDLFILTSSDWGHNWTAPVEVYNEDANPGNMARYPSVYAFEFEDEMSFVFTSPITNGSGWFGFINGLLYEGSPITIFQSSFDIDGTTYGWGGTDSKIVGGIIDDQPYGLAVGNLMPAGGLPLSITSSIGQRFTTDFETWTPTIPSAWAASNFVEPTPSGSFTDSLRTSLTLSLKKELTNNTLYFTAYGRFVSADNQDKWLPGVSKSQDNGTTWSDFEVFPWQVINDYVIGLNVNPDAVFIDRGAGDFVQFPNGDYSYIVTINEDTTITGTLYAQALHRIVELYKEGDQFGIRHVGDYSGYTLAYVGATGNNQMGNELMATRTVDGTKMLAKWVDFVYWISDQGDTVFTTDILVAVRDRAKDEWSRTKDITDSEIYDRITWIPDFIPNDLKNIPILKLESVPNPNDSPEEARVRQRTLETERQYVKIANFDADDLLVVGVEENKTDFEIGNVYPNPATDNVFVNMNLPESGRMNIELVDLFGRTVKNLYDGYVNGGISALNLNLGNQAAGIYFLKMNYNGNIISKTVNIIK